MLRKLFILSLAFSLLAGVGLGIYFLRPSKRYARHYQKGLIYFNQGKYAKSAIEFYAAKKIKDEDKTLLMYLAESYRKNNEHEESISILKQLVVKYPKDQELSTILAKNYIANKDYQKALAVSQRFLKKNGENAELLNQRGIIFTFLEQSESAKVDFLKSIELDSKEANAYSNLARVYWTEKDFEGTFQTLGQFLEIEPNDYAIRNELGDYYFSINRLDEAIEHFFYLYEKNPKKLLETSGKLSLALLMADKKTKLEKVLDTVFSKNPSKLEVSPLLFYARGVLQLEKKEYEKAISDFEFAQLRNLKLANLKYSLAKCYNKTGKVFLAIKELETLLEVQADYLPAHLLLVQILINEDDAVKAVNHCDRYLNQMPKNRQLIEIKALAMAGTGRRQLTEKMYEELSQIDDSYSSKRSSILLDILQGKNKKAIEKLKEILKEETQSPHLVSLLLARNYLIIHDYDKAVEHLNVAMESEPFRLSAEQVLAQVYTSSQKYEKAIEQYNKVLEEDPNHHRVPFELAELYHNLKQNPKALDVLKKYNKINSSKSLYLELLANISLSEQKYHEAAKYLEKIKSKTISQKNLLGDIYQRLGKQKESINTYGEEESNPEILIRQGLALFLDEKWSKAVPKLAKYVSLKPKQIYPNIAYCVALIQNNNLEEALKHSNEMLREINSQTWLVRFVRGIIFLKNDSFSIALKELEKVPAADQAIMEGVKSILQFSAKQNLDVLPVLTVLLISEMGDPVVALKLYRKLSVLIKRTLFASYLESMLMEKTGQRDKFQISIDSLSSKPNLPAYINAFIGRSLNHQDRFEEAEKFMVKALPMYQENPGMIMELAINYNLRGKSKEALETFEKAANIKQTEQNKETIAHACNNTAWLMARDYPSKLKEALQYATKANKTIPNYAPFLDTLSWVYFKGKKWDKAEAYMIKTLEISPLKNSTKFRLAQLYIEQNKKQKAKKLLQEILESGEANKNKTKVQELLDSIN